MTTRYHLDPTNPSPHTLQQGLHVCVRHFAILCMHACNQGFYLWCNAVPMNNLQTCQRGSPLIYKFINTCTCQWVSLPNILWANLSFEKNRFMHLLSLVSCLDLLQTAYSCPNCNFDLRRSNWKVMYWTKSQKSAPYRADKRLNGECICCCF